MVKRIYKLIGLTEEQLFVMDGLRHIWKRFIQSNSCFKDPESPWKFYHAVYEYVVATFTDNEILGMFVEYDYSSEEKI